MAAPRALALAAIGSLPHELAGGFEMSEGAGDVELRIASAPRLSGRYHVLVIALLYGLVIPVSRVDQRELRDRARKTTVPGSSLVSGAG